MAGHPDDLYIVVCTDDGRYVLATRQVFQTRMVAEAYAAGVAASRMPVVVAGRFHQLRLGQGW
jgi:hypothetical protein